MNSTVQYLIDVLSSYFRFLSSSGNLKFCHYFTTFCDIKEWWT